MSKIALEWVIVFGAMFALDFVWAHYTRAVQSHRALAAAWWAVAILIFNGIAQIAYIHDPWMLLPAALGAFGGTYLAMRTHKEPLYPQGSQPPKRID